MNRYIIYFWEGETPGNTDSMYVEATNPNEALVKFEEIKPNRTPVHILLDSPGDVNGNS